MKLKWVEQLNVEDGDYNGDTHVNAWWLVNGVRKAGNPRTFHAHTPIEFGISLLSVLVHEHNVNTSRSSKLTSDYSTTVEDIAYCLDIVLLSVLGSINFYLQ